MSVRYLPIAVRAFSVPEGSAARRPSGTYTGHRDWPDRVLLFDTETTTDKMQRFLFGSYRISRWHGNPPRLVCEEEALIHADGLWKFDPEGWKCLREYVRTREATNETSGDLRLRLLSRSQFVEEVFWHTAYKARALVVGFNLPFDLSRIAIHVGPGRREARGGFSLALWRWKGKPSQYRPRIVIRHLDSKRAFIWFTRPGTIDPEDQRPADGFPPDPRFSFSGRFLDLRTLAFALTSQPTRSTRPGRPSGSPTARPRPRATA